MVLWPVYSVCILDSLKGSAKLDATLVLSWSPVKDTLSTFFNNPITAPRMDKPHSTTADDVPVSWPDPLGHGMLLIHFGSTEHPSGLDIRAWTSLHC